MPTAKWLQVLLINTYSNQHYSFAQSQIVPSIVIPIIQFRYTVIPDIGLAVRVFANGPGDLGSISGRVIPKTQKMVLGVSLLNTQHYKVRIKGKWSIPGKGVAPSPTPWCSKLSKREPSGHPRLWSPTLLYFYTVKEFQVLLCNTNNSEQHYSFNCI